MGRLLHVVLMATAVAAQFGPPPPPSGGYPPAPNSGCALIIPGPGRSAAFDHAAGVFGPGYPSQPYTENTCITYEAVNAAFVSSRDRVGLPRTSGKFAEIENIGNLGTVIHEASRYLAKQYGLSKDAIANGLPLIDTTKTAIGGYCPEFLLPVKCDVERYRSVRGTCNNLENPHWGAGTEAHHRFLPPDYADGVSAPRYAQHAFNTKPTSSSIFEKCTLLAWILFVIYNVNKSADMDPSLTDRHIID